MIPEGWKKVKWGDVATIEYGKSLKDYRASGGPYPVYGTNGLIGYTDKSLCHFPSVIVGRKGAYRGIHYSKTPFYVIDTAFYLKPKGDELNLKYAYYQLLTLNINDMDSGSAIPSTSRPDFYNLDLNLPDIHSQQKITSILSSIDDKIELNLRMNKTLEAIAQAIFKEWFNDPKTVALSEYIQINPSLTIKKGAITKYVEMRDIPQMGSSIESFIKRPFSAGSKFQNLDTLLARITPCLENGKTAFVDNLEDNEIGFGSTEFIVLRANKGISPYAVYLLARDKNFRAFAIKSMSGTSGRQRVQSDLLNSYQVANVDSQKMQKFDLLVRPLFIKIKSNSENNHALSQLRDILLPKLMTGKIKLY